MKNKNKEDKTLKGKSKQPFGEGFFEDLEIKQILFFTTIIIQFILILNLYGKIEDLSIDDFQQIEDYFWTVGVKTQKFWPVREKYHLLLLLANNPPTTTAS